MSSDAYDHCERTGCSVTSGGATLSPRLRQSAEHPAELVFDALEAALVRPRQRPPGAIDIEVQHRHRRLKSGATFRAATALDGSLQAARDRVRRSLEDAGRKIHSVGRFLHVTDPRLRSTRGASIRARSGCPHVLVLPVCLILSPA